MPHSAVTNALNYNAISQEPARGVTVQAVDGMGTVLATTVTDLSGDYSLDVGSNTNVRIQALSQLQQSATSSWDIEVLDNTSGNAIYALTGSLTNTGTSNSIRDLNAGSGWNGTAYTSTRAAAPFAILDTMFEIILAIEAIDADVSFPALEVLWSVNNRPADGDIAQGEIGTSFFTILNGVPTIAILGAANTDTDEYDRHVVVHEFGHYFESQLSRSDSIGGPHSLSSVLDARLAFSEGFANALSGIVLDDPIYRDSQGNSQAQGFSFSVESTLSTNRGFYSQVSTQSIIYDIFDDNDDAADTISAGLEPIYMVFTDPDFINNTNRVTIYTFIDVLRSNGAVDNAVLDALLDQQVITGTGPLGEGETNDGGISIALPLFNPITVGGPAVEVCSFNNAGTFNRLGNREFLLFSLDSARTLTFRMARTMGDINRDPDFRIFDRSNFINQGISGDVDVETLSIALQPGNYVIEAFDFFNIAANTANSGDSCYDFTIQ